MKHEMRVIDPSGDTKVIWDSDNKDEVEAARDTFNTLVKDKKYAAFTVKKGGDKHKRIYSFDKLEEKLILVPPMAGG